MKKTVIKINGVEQEIELYEENEKDIFVDYEIVNKLENTLDLEKVLKEMDVNNYE